jgi:membrane-associated phospholipid phosphatase
LALAAIPALTIDLPLSRWCMQDRLPGDLARLLGFAEVFGHGLGVALLLLAIYQLDPLHRWALPRVVASAYGAGLAANLVKMVVGRARPHHFEFNEGVLNSFGPWLPLTSAGSGGQSFPSAHTATAAGLAVALVWLYPAGRWLFPAMVFLVACQRINSGAHFLSDTLVGAALGLLVGQAVVHCGPVARWFGRLEKRWRASVGSSA